MSLPSPRTPETITDRSPRRPGRPRQAILDVETIVDHALNIAGSEGFPAVTMNRLARDLNVTARALYNHVSNRQEIVDKVWQRIVETIPKLELDPENWQESVRNLYADLRDHFRQFPRVLMVVHEERLSPSEAGRRRLVMAEEGLQFFTELGLSLHQATIARELILMDIFAFSLSIDFVVDQLPEEDNDPGFYVPPSLIALDPKLDLAVPLVEKAISGVQFDTEELFESMVDSRIITIQRMLARV